MTQIETKPVRDASHEQQLALLYLSSPTLPIGSFAYSQGLESAIELGFVTEQSTLKAWCRDVLALGISKLDCPVLLAMRSSIDAANQDQFDYWNDFIFASRETAELVEEESNLGLSLARLIKTQTMLAGNTPDNIELPKKPSLLASFALCSRALGLTENMMLMSFIWAWLENQVAVACKAIPIGQSDGQGVLLELRQQIVELIDLVQMPDENFVGSSLPGQAMLSAFHETQYSRLFRS